jgi:CO/xanthine dehydrogenase FAD-binding subunit
MPAPTLEAPELLQPSSPAEAAAAFGDGAGVTVLAGGTIVVPEMTHNRLRPGRVLLLGRAGLDQLARTGSTWRIGATVSLETVAQEGPEPLRTAARRVADREIRGQATLGGNLCAPPGVETPRGDLQAALLAVGARVVSAGGGGERTESVDDFLAGVGASSGASGEAAGSRLVLAVEVDEAEAASYVSLGRPHAHTYTMLAVAAARTAQGTRVAVGGASPRGVRAPSVERALAGGASAADAAAAVLDDVTPQDDALASAWYRTRVLPGLVAQALTALERS